MIPADYDIPGSFGVIYTNASFIETNPTAAEDFMRATMRGLHDAIADPACDLSQVIQPATSLKNLYIAPARIALTEKYAKAVACLDKSTAQNTSRLMGFEPANTVSGCGL